MRDVAKVLLSQSIDSLAKALLSRDDGTFDRMGIGSRHRLLLLLRCLLTGRRHYITSRVDVKRNAQIQLTIANGRF